MMCAVVLTVVVGFLVDTSNELAEDILFVVRGVEGLVLFFQPMHVRRYLLTCCLVLLLSLVLHAAYTIVCWLYGTRVVVLVCVAISRHATRRERTCWRLVSYFDPCGR